MAVWECEGEDKAIWKGASGENGGRFEKDQEVVLKEEVNGKIVRRIVCRGEGGERRKAFVFCILSTGIGLWAKGRQCCDEASRGTETDWKEN
jgi:hypothetical protein